MAVVSDVDTLAPPQPAGPGATPAPLIALHAAAIAVVLLAIMAWIGPGSFTIDESAYRTQAALLGEGQLQAYPTDTLIDQDRVAPLALSQTTSAGWAAYARHPLYPLLVSWSTTLSDTYGPVVLSIFGALLAAVGIGRLRGSIDGGSPIPAMWVAALASPLMVHSQVVWAHALATGLLSFGLSLVVDAMGRDRGWWRYATIGGALIAACAFLRTEAPFVVVAIAAATFLLANGERARWVGVNLLVAGPVVVAAFVDRLWAQSVLEGRTSLDAVGSSESWLVERVSGAVNLLISVGGSAPAQAWLLVVLLLGIAGAKANSSTPDAGLVRLLSGVAVVAALVAVTSVQSLPGWLPALPFVGVVLPAAWRVPPARPFVTFVLVFVGTILVIVPAEAGGLGWGGRYILFALPPLVAVAVVVAEELRTDASGRIVLAAGLAATALVQVNGLRVLERNHEASVAVEARLDAFFDAQPTDLLMVAPDIRVGRSAPSAAIEVPLMSPGDPDQFPQVLDLVVDAGVEQVLVVELRDHDIVDIPTGWTIVSDEDDGLVRSRLIEAAP